MVIKMVETIQDLTNGSATGVGVSLLKNVHANGVNGTALPKLESWKKDLNQDDKAVLALRNLIFDICNHNGGGHGGSAIGMAAIGVALYKHIMRYNPSDPNWFDRDRFVLSNGEKLTRLGQRVANILSQGHCAMWLYALNHLAGFENWTMDEIRGYGSAKIKGYTTICHAHPEIEIPGVEVTTGPLGQGIANAVGLAIASKNLAARYNQPGFEVIKSKIYCMTGDGCLMEGVALESISLAGSLGLDNLVLIYDNNQVTCDGPLDWINTEDINSKMRASGWHVLDILDGSYDVEVIVSAFRLAKALTKKPVFINIRTVIGLGTKVAGTFKAHHGAFDEDSVALSKQLAGQDPSVIHVIPVDTLSYFRERKTHGEKMQRQWDEMITSYSSTHKDLAASFNATRNADYGSDWLDILTGLDAENFEGLATREVNGILIEKMWAAYPAFCGGGADLVNSNKVSYTETDVFHPDVSFAGRYIRYGIREHAMASISNGIAAYNPGSFLPITATFFMFYIYVSPSTYCLVLEVSLTSIGCSRGSHGGTQPSACYSLCNARFICRRTERTNPSTSRT